MKHLTVAYALGFRIIPLNLSYGHRLPSPCMVYDKFGIDTKQLIKKIPVSKRTFGNISHRFDSVICKLNHCAVTHTPKIRKWLMLP